MEVGERIKQRRKELKMSADILAEKLGISRSTVFRYEKGEIEKMPTETIGEIAQILNTTPGYLMGWNETIIDSTINIMNNLDETNQRKVYNFAEEQLKEQNKVLQVNFNKTKLNKVEVALGVSAGVGYGNDYDLAEFTSFYTNEDIRNYDFALYVNGNSMEPKLHDGDIILLQETGTPDNGDIYAVLHDESLYVKQIHIEDDKFIMHSLNPKYGDITISLGEDIEPPKIIGKVVDSFTPMEVD